MVRQQCLGRTDLPLDATADCSPERGPRSKVEESGCLQDDDKLSESAVDWYEHEFLKGDPFQDCQDLVQQDLAEWLLDFMVLQGKEKTPQIRCMIAALISEDEAQWGSRRPLGFPLGQPAPSDEARAAEEHALCSGQWLETLKSLDRGSVLSDSRSTSCSFGCSSLRSSTQAESNRTSMETNLGLPTAAEPHQMIGVRPSEMIGMPLPAEPSVPSADWNATSSDDWELEFLIREELENERAKQRSLLRGRSSSSSPKWYTVLNTPGQRSVAIRTEAGDTSGSAPAEKPAASFFDEVSDTITNSLFGKPSPAADKRVGDARLAAWMDEAPNTLQGPASSNDHCRELLRESRELFHRACEMGEQSTYVQGSKGPTPNDDKSTSSSSKRLLFYV